MFKVTGFKVGLPGVSITISFEIEPGKWFAVKNLTTDKNGRASVFWGGQEKSGKYHFSYRKADYLDADTEDYYEGGGTYEIEQALTMEGYETFEETEWGKKRLALELGWTAQTEMEKLANSFIASLAIIMVFKVLQGFSMERINPVA